MSDCARVGSEEPRGEQSGGTGLGGHMPSAANGRPARLLYKVGCSLLSVALAFSTVPTAAIAQNSDIVDSGEAVSSYHPDFTLDDIALPEGYEFDENGGIVIDEAVAGDDEVPLLEDAETNSLPVAKPEDAESNGDDADQPEGIEASAGATTLMNALPNPICLVGGVDSSTQTDDVKEKTGKKKDKYDKAYDQKYKTWKRYGKTVDFAVDGLHLVNKTAGRVGDYGLALFDMIKGCALGDFCEVFYGGMSLLQLLGIRCGEESKGVSNEDLMEGITDIKAMMGVMSERLNEVSRKQDLSFTQPLVADLWAMTKDCEKAETMFSNARLVAQWRGVKPPEAPVNPEMPFKGLPTVPSTVQPKLPWKEELKLPAEPTKPELPAEPTKPELPAEPTKLELPVEPQQKELPPEPVSPNDLFWGADVDDSDSKWKEQLADWKARYGIVPENTRGSMNQQYAESLYQQAHAAWEGEVASIQAQHEQDMVEWQAECDRLNDESEQARADWQAECDRLNAEYKKAHTDWKAEYDRLKADYDKAYVKWQAECDHYADAKAKQERAIAEWNDGTTAAKFAKQCEEYTKQLVKIMKEQEKEGSEYNQFFDGFSKVIERIEVNYEKAVGECVKDGEANPFYAYDSYLSKCFNWDTQGYFLRKAYRAYVEYPLKRSYDIIAAYRNLLSPDAIRDTFEDDEDEDGGLKNPYTGYTWELIDALSILEEPVGISPESIDPNGKYAVRCNVNGRVATGSHVGYRDEGRVFEDQEIEEYVRRLKDPSVKDDLKAAGLYSPNIDDPEKSYPGAEPVAGIAIYSKAEGGLDDPEWEELLNEVFCEKRHWDARILKWDGSLNWDKSHATVQTCRREQYGTTSGETEYLNLNCSYVWFDWQ